MRAGEPVYTTLSIPVVDPVPPTTEVLADNDAGPSAAGQPVSFTVAVSGELGISGETVTIEDASNANAVVASPTLAGGASPSAFSNLSVRHAPAVRRRLTGIRPTPPATIRRTPVTQV